MFKEILIINLQKNNNFIFNTLHSDQKNVFWNFNLVCLLFVLTWFLLLYMLMCHMVKMNIFHFHQPHPTHTHTHTHPSVLVIIFLSFLYLLEAEIYKLWFSFSRAKLFGGKRVFRNLDSKYQEQKSEGDSHEPINIRLKKNMKLLFSYKIKPF